MTEQSLQIAQALERLVAKAISDFEFAMDVLKIEPSVRAPMWEAMARRAMEKVVECEGRK